MANKISIIIEAQNRAAAPLRQVQKQVSTLGMNLKEFNRGLFATTAVIGTFMLGVSKAIEGAKLGAQFSFIRQNFTRTFGPEYLTILQKATRGTVDAMTLMESALRLRTGGVGREETTQLVKMASLIAKLRPEKDPSQVVNELTEAYRKGTPEAFANYFAQLKLSNAYQIQQKMLHMTIKGWGDARMQMALTRRYELKLMNEALEKAAITGNDMLDVVRRTAVGFKNLRMQVGEFVAQAVTPLGGYISDLASSAFDKLYNIMSSTDRRVVSMRTGWINLIKVIGGGLGVLTGLWTGMQLVNFTLTTLGITLGGFTGGLMLAALAIMRLKDSTQTWGEFLADIGTVLKAAWEAFSTYHDGVITLSGAVYARLNKMGPEWQNVAMFIVKGASLLREALRGAAEGFMTIFNGAVKVLKVFGLLGDHTKQMSSMWMTLAKWLGRGAGALAALYGLKLAGGALGLGRLPIIGRFFGGAGGGGKRGESPERPLFVQEVGQLISGGKGIYQYIKGLFAPRPTMGTARGSQGELFGPSVAQVGGGMLKRGLGSLGRFAASSQMGTIGTRLGVGTLMEMLGGGILATIITTVLAALAAAGAVFWAYKAAKKAFAGDFTGAAAPGGYVGDAIYKATHWNKPGEEQSLVGKMYDKGTSYEGGAGAKQALMNAMLPVFQDKIKLDDSMMARILKDGNVDSKEQKEILKAISTKLNPQPEPTGPRKFNSPSR